MLEIRGRGLCSKAWTRTLKRKMVVGAKRPPLMGKTVVLQFNNCGGSAKA